MIKEIELTIHPDFLNDYNYQKFLAAQYLQINPVEITAVQAIRRSIDARHSPVFKIKYLVYINEPLKELFHEIIFKPVEDRKKVIIVGCGPAGMFAALKLIESGIKPVILERGKDVRTRRFDLKAIQQDNIVNPDSNYCFGEGGAGTYSDGKLYTRSLKRGNVNRILNLFVQHGAQNEILIDAHPHIGSNVLPKIVEAIRDTILSNGGEIYFNSRVTDLIITENKINGVIINEQREIFGDAVILATGHSARDIYYLLQNKNIKVEAKPFAMGVRIEHPQQLIDQIQYHSKQRHSNLPASNYSLTCQVDDRGIYSFCMCPGGIIIPAATSPGEIVLNGMSISRRDSKYANSGLVVTIIEEDWKEYSSHGIFAGLKFQETFERTMFEAAGRTQKAPAQRLIDFSNNKISSSLPDASYIPGTISLPLHELLPKNIALKLQASIKVFEKKMRGFLTEEAQMLAPESRTSSPIRIPRDTETLMHPEISGLFPAGEGAGYAGGIVSAAIDGERCAEAVQKYLQRV
ncbi:MAG: NAD(P)/FAD-dependent oxidoreductase [bacterium]